MRSTVIAASFLLGATLVPFAAYSQTLRDGVEAYTARRYDEAAQIFRALAEKGSVRAQTNLGAMYMTGLGVSRDGKEAVKWLTLASNQGDITAKQDLAQAYAHGFGVPMNLETAFKLFREAATQGDAMSQSQLGFMYENGKGTKGDQMKAYVWYSLSGSMAPSWAKSSLEALRRHMSDTQLREAEIALKYCRMDLQKC